MGRKRRNLKAEHKQAWWVWWDGPWPWVCFLAVLAFALYANTLGHGFVIDDIPLISQSSVVSQLNWQAILSPSGYHPIRTFTYALNYLLGGPDPFGYHLFNVILHCANVVILFSLILRLTGLVMVAGTGALLFAVHPVQTAAVAYVSGRKDELATLFILVACHAYISYRRGSGARYAFVTGVLFALAIMAKEVAVVLPVLLLLMDALVLERGTEGENNQNSLLQKLVRPIKQVPAFYAVCLVFLATGAYYAMFVVKASRMTEFWGGSAWTHYGTSFKLFLHYAKLAIFPYPLIADYTGQVFDLSTGIFEPATLVSIAFLGGYLYAAFRAHRRNSLVTFGMLWFLTGLLPILQIVPFHELAADHFLYLPLVGVALMAGLAAKLLKDQWGNAVAGVIVVAVAVCFSLMTVDRNRDWKDEYTLWTETYRVAPGSYRANHNLGIFYYERGDTEKAIHHTERSIELDSTREQAWSNLGALYRVRASGAWDAGDLDSAQFWSDRALERLKRSIEMNPQDLWAWANLGQVYRLQGQIAEKRGEASQAFELRTQALHHFDRALAIGSDNPNFRLIWGEKAKIFMDAGLWDQALDYLQPAFVAFPNRTDLLYSMGLCHYRLRQYSSAIPYFQKVVQAAPSIELWGMLAKCYEEIGENYTAIKVYEKALSRYSQSVEINYNLGVLYHRIGDTDKAVRYLEQALALAPEGRLAGNIEKMLGLIRGDS